MSKYDGSINIDTSIDSKGFNAGMAKISSSIKSAGSGIVSVLATVSVVAVTIVAAIAAIAVSLVTMAVGAAVFGVKLINAMSQAVSSASEYGQEIAKIKVLFADVKGAAYAAFSPLITAALPYIQLVVNWLVKLLNLISMIVAALTGQKTVQQYIAGSAASAATSTGKLADNTNKATKAAKGALAAFDQLNVLQQDTADESDASSAGGGSGGTMQFEAVPISDAAQAFADKVKGIFESVKNAVVGVWDWIKQAATNTWNWIVGIWTPIGSWLQDNVITPIWTRILWLWDIIKTSATDLWEGGLKNVFMSVYTFIQDVFVARFQNSLNMIGNIFKDLSLIVAGVVDSILQILGGIIEFVTGVFTGDWEKAWQGIQDIFKGIFNGIATIVFGVANVVIDIVNGIVSAVVIGMNAVIEALNTIQIAIPGWVPKFGGSVFGLNITELTAPEIPKLTMPKLATGAVIPANSEFLAVLGDQKSGRNIEAPESLIRQIIQEEMGSVKTDVTISFAGSLSALVKELKPYIEKENTRIGTQLIIGGTA